jgi:hypothetical protein
MIPWAFGDACTTGFGEYLIVDGKTGRRLDCIVPLANRTSIGPSSLGHFGKNDSKCFESDLTSVYGITNSGIYWIQAVGRFSYIESPSKQFTISTPPVIIFISRNVDTNAPPK